jgi:DNA-binding transcriptional MerR regulator
MATAAARGLRVAELAAAVDVPPDTIRYYGRAGLLPAPDRTAAGYREYAEAAVDRLRFTRGAQRLGLRLADIRMPPRRPRHRHLPLRAGRAAPAPAAGRGRRRGRRAHRAARRDGGDGRRAAHGHLPSTEPRHLVPTRGGR